MVDAFVSTAQRKRSELVDPASNDVDRTVAPLPIVFSIQSISAPVVVFSVILMPL